MSRRAEACITACAGIPTEALEAGVVGEILEAFGKAMDMIDIHNDIHAPEHSVCSDLQLKTLQSILATVQGKP